MTELSFWLTLAGNTSTTVSKYRRTKNLNSKQNVKGDTDLEDFDFDDYDEDEPEPDEGDGLSDEEQEDEEA